VHSRFQSTKKNGYQQRAQHCPADRTGDIAGIRGQPEHHGDFNVAERPGRSNLLQTNGVQVVASFTVRTVDEIRRARRAPECSKCAVRYDIAQQMKKYNIRSSGSYFGIGTW